MTKKLLRKTSNAYLLFSALLLLVSAPLFYYTTERLYIEETDETLILHKNEFIKYSLPTFKMDEISKWNQYNRNIKIKPYKHIGNDTIFYSSYYDTLEAETEPYRELNASVRLDGNSFTYSSRINLVESEDLMESIALLFLAIIFLFLVGLLVITKRLSIKLWKPFNVTLNQIEKFEIDKSNQPIFIETDIEEFQRLNKSVEKLIEKNTAIFHSQREFVDNAAHELQTPLAIFQANIDTLIQSSGFTQEQCKMLGSLNESVFRLTRLNKNLLLLSKLENDNYSEKETIYLSQTITKHIDFFTEQATSKKLNIKMDLFEKASIKSNSVLAEILISNLFLNAIRHNIKGGVIIVKLTNESLIFSNTGQSHPLIAQSLFQRFSKSNPSEQGNGLGLSIIKKIVTLNNWTISYSFADDIHSFSVTF